MKEMLYEDVEVVDSLEGIMLTEYFPKDGKGQSYDDIKKIHYETVDKNGQWFSMWCWKPLGCAAPEHISPRYGIRVIPINSIKISIEEAIEEFHRGDWGSYFVDRITLSWPLYPGCDEPTYLFQSDLGVYVHIGAYTKKVNSQNADSNKNFNTRASIAEKIGVSEAQLAKIEHLSKAGVVVGGSIHKDFSINIVNGSGCFSYSKNTWWVTINASGKIIAPPEGIWHIIVKDGDKVIFDKAGIKAGDLISFSYHTGFSIDLTMTAIWSEQKNTTLTGYLDISY